MAIGGALPPALLRQSVIRQLTAGAVVKLLATMDDGREHEKRFVIVHVDEGAFAFVLNSELHSIILRNADVLRCQVTVPAGHDFVDHECYLDCSRLRKFATSEVVNQLVANPLWILGRITAGMRDEIRGALQHSPLIPLPDAAQCCASLDAIQFEP